MMDKHLVRRISIIAGFRLLLFLSGLLMCTRFADWRQVAGYPLLLLGSLPDALVVSAIIISPRSAHWPWVMVVSLLASSAVLAAIWGRRTPRRASAAPVKADQD